MASCTVKRKAEIDISKRKAFFFWENKKLVPVELVLHYVEHPPCEGVVTAETFYIYNVLMNEHNNINLRFARDIYRQFARDKRFL